MGTRKGVITMAALMVSGMTGQGSVSHNNRNFYAHNVDKSRSNQNVIFLREDIKAVYHQLFDQALEAYNGKKKKTRDKIPDYYEHIRQGKQEKLFHEVIFQIGNKDTCPCGSPEGAQVAEILKDFTRTFQNRNPHLKVFNAVLHMDEATPHVHIDFIPFATDQKRGLSTRVSMKQALKQQGFTGTSKQNSEWTRWIESEKQALEAMAKERGLEIAHGTGGRQHLDTPTYIAAKRREEEAIARCTALQQQEQQAADGLLRASESLQNAQTELDRVQGAVDALSASEVNLRRSTASLAEECDALRRSTASPDAVDAAKRAAQSGRVLHRGQVILPAKEFEQLLTTAQASAINHQEAVAARVEASKAKQDAQNTARYCKSLQDELARIKPAAKLGELFAQKNELTSFHTITSSWGMKIARLVYRVLGKPIPEQQQQPTRTSGFNSQLDSARGIAAEQNQRHQPGLLNSRKRDGHEH